MENEPDNVTPITLSKNGDRPRQVTSIEQMRSADWEGMRQETIFKLCVLEAMVMQLDPNNINDKIAQELILPALALIADFNTRIIIGEEQNEGQPTATEA